MSSNKVKKALFIVEGKKLEPEFLNCFLTKMNEKENGENAVPFEIYSVGENIYYLYQRLKKEHFYCDIRDILKENHRDEVDILSQTFTHTYLIFDFDAHHPEKDEVRAMEDIVTDNIRKLREMSAYFFNETDPSIGKLYINYPMMESFRTADDFFDVGYKDEYTALSDLENFKIYASHKKLSSQFGKKSWDKRKYGDFAKLTLMNLYKLNQLCLGEWQSMTYSDYINRCNASYILDCQKYHEIMQNSRVAVLNTMLFIWLDYYGNRNKKFDSFVRDTEDSVLAPALV